MWKTCITVTLEDVTVDMRVVMVNGIGNLKVERLKQWGCDGVELLTLGRLTEGRYREISSMLQSQGIEVCAVSSGAVRTVLGTTLMGGGREGEEVLIGLIDAARWLNAPVVTIGSFRGLIDERPEGSEYLRAVIRRAAEYSGDRNVKVAIEPLNRYETDYLTTIDDALDFVGSISMDNVGVLPDLFHLNIEESTMHESIGRCIQANRLFHLHVADSNRQLPGRGHIDFHPILRTLENGGYEGAVSGELARGEVPEDEAVLEYCRYLKTQRRETDRLRQAFERNHGQ